MKGKDKGDQSENEDVLELMLREDFFLVFILTQNIGQSGIGPRTMRSSPMGKGLITKYRAAGMMWRF